MAYFAHLLSFLVLTTTLMFFFISPSQSIPSPPPAKPPSPPVKPPKVDLVLYYETLCPPCADFITTDLVKVFQTDLNTIVNLRLVPWGNAKVINSTIVCQKKHFPFISCIEAENSAMHSKDVEKSLRKCAHNLGFPQEPIDKCYNSGEGIKNYLDYIRYVCKAYKGKPIVACSSKLSSSTLKDTSTNPVCYTEKSRNSSSFFVVDDLETEGTKRPHPPG
ncbi:hypothetical protein LWI29_020046 [Acer saccharum]|uniref:Gamma-interferon-inducible lysosomal thiol reductase n=1 Tax=Acer saccharum TaxID=4024 RepID=A0AA39S5R3_ACESA|nr:hypothetical protein LWI29_020046 [Acer saccharum]